MKKKTPNIQYKINDKSSKHQQDTQHLESLEIVFAVRASLQKGFIDCQKSDAQNFSKYHALRSTGRKRRREV